MPLSSRVFTLAKKPLFLACFILSLGLVLALSAGVVSPNDVLERLSSWQRFDSDSGFDTGESGGEDEIEFDSEDLIGEAPESLRPHAAQDPFVASVLGPLGLLETLAPGAPAQTAFVFDRDAILDDYRGRMSEAFKIPEGLRDRVGFWFDVYTKHDSNRRIIHHALYPWIVYKVVDVSFIIESDSPRRMWMRREKANRYVKREALKIRAALRALSLKKATAKQNETEREVAAALLNLGGDTRKQARVAVRHVRVQTGQKNFFFEGLHLSRRFMPTMEKIFQAKGLPVELTRIPFVESSFNKHATSKVGASGIWQFMDGTGRKFMLVDGHIDERRSPLKATEAAASLLKESHMILHRSWPLAVTAWNHGPGGVRKASRAAGSRDLSTIIKRYRSRSFDFASSNFYSEFLAALYAARYGDEAFGPIENLQEEALHHVKLARSIRFKDLLRVSGMSLDDFLTINPDLVVVARRNLKLPRGFKLHVPTSALAGLERWVAGSKDRPVRVKVSESSG